MSPEPRAARRVRTKRGMGWAGRMALLGRGPGGVRIVAADLSRLARRVGPEVLLEDDSRLVDQKRLHSGGGVGGWVRHQGEAIHELAVHLVIASSAIGVRSLGGEDPVAVAPVGTGLAVLDRVAGLSGTSHRGAHRALRLALLGGPVEPVALARRADETVGVVRHRRPVRTARLAVAL